MAETTKKKTRVFIITKNGKAYNNEGLNYIRNALSEDYGENDDMEFLAGETYNNVRHLKKEIGKTGTKPYIVLSRDDGITFFGPKGMDKIKSNLSYYDDKTSWEILSMTMGLPI